MALPAPEQCPEFPSGGAIYLGNTHTGISGQIDSLEMEAGVAAAVQYWLGPF